MILFENILLHGAMHLSDMYNDTLLLLVTIPDSQKSHQHGAAQLVTSLLPCVHYMQHTAQYCHQTVHRNTQSNRLSNTTVVV